MTEWRVVKLSRPGELFLSDEDRRAFLAVMRGAVHRGELQVAGYSLLRSQARLLIVSGNPGGVRQQYAGWLAGRGVVAARSAIWSQPAESPWEALRQIELLPVRHGVVEHPEDWSWSSARDHMGLRKDRGLLADAAFRERFTPAQWACVLRAELRPKLRNQVAADDSRALGPAVVEVRQANVVQPKQMKNRRVDVMHMAGLFDGT